MIIRGVTLADRKSIFVYDPSHTSTVFVEGRQLKIVEQLTQGHTLIKLKIKEQNS